MLQTITAYFALACVAGIGALILSSYLRRLIRRRRALERSFPDAWKHLLAQRVVLYRVLPPQLRENLHRSILLFLLEKTFEGCDGLTVTEDMKVIIAAEACLLRVNMTEKQYKNLRSILLYPHAYVSLQTRLTDGYVVRQEDTCRAGESWTLGDVVLAWDIANQTAHTTHAASNVVLHEFAHQLDHENGAMDGVPRLDSAAAYAEWQRIIGAAYTTFTARVAHGAPHFMDAYGATNPAEFFAVATETFFTQPEAFHAHEPAVYQTLASYYRVDPRTWKDTLVEDPATCAC